MARRLIITLAAVAGLVIATAAAVALFRAALVEWLVERQLAALGVPDAEVEVTAIGPKRARIGGLALGAADEMRARSATVDYRIMKLLGGEIDRVVVEGLTLKLHLGGEQPLLGSLQPLMSAGGDGGGTLPEFVLQEARVEAETPLGPVVATFDGEVAPGPEGSLAIAANGAIASRYGEIFGLLNATARGDGQLAGTLVVENGAVTLQQATAAPAVVAGLSGAIAFDLGASGLRSLTAQLELDDIGVGGTRIERAQVSADVGEDRVSLEARLRYDRDFDVTLTASATDYRTAPRVAADLEAEVAAGSGLWQRFGLEQPTNGSARLVAEAEGTLPRPPGALGEPRALLAWVTRGDLGARVQASVSDAELPGLLANLAAETVLTATLADGTLRLELPEAAEVRVGQLQRPPLTAAGIPPALIDLVAGGASLRLAGSTSARLDAHPDSGSVIEVSSPGAILSTPAGAALEVAGGALVALTPDGGLKSLTVAGLTVSGHDLRIAGQQIAAIDLAAELSGTGDRLSGDGKLQVRLDAPGVADAEAETAELTWPFRLEQDAVGWRAEGEVTLSVGHPRLAKTTAQAATLMGPIQLRLADAVLEASGAARLRLEQMTAGDAGAGRVELHLPFQVVAQEGVLAVKLRQAGRLEARELHFGETVRSDGAKVRIAEGGIALAADGSLRLEPAIVLATDRGESLRLAVARQDAPPLILEFGFPRLTVQGRAPAKTPAEVNVVFRDARLAVPEVGIAIDGLTLDGTVTAPPGLPSVEIAARTVQHTATPAFFTPFAITGRLRPGQGGLTLAAEGGWPDSAATLAVEGRYDPAGKRGYVSLRLPALTFAPGGLQPGQVSPLLADLTAVRGTLAAQVELEVAPEGLDSEGTVTLEDVDFQLRGTAVEGLSLALHLDDLLPLSSPPGQRLEIARVNAVMPIDAVEARFQVLPGEQATVLVEDAGFRLAGGEFQLRDQVIDLAEESMPVTLMVSRLDLEQLFETLDIEGLSGSGILSGSIPLRIETGTIVVADAELVATGPGVLRYSSEKARRLLAGQGESVELAVKALENFQYETLTISLEKDAADRAQVLFSILGNNPEVLEGYPFKINIDLTSDLKPILDALRQGYNLSSDLIGRAWRLGR